MVPSLNSARCWMEQRLRMTFFAALRETAGRILQGQNNRMMGGVIQPNCLLSDRLPSDMNLLRALTTQVWGISCLSLEIFCLFCATCSTFFLFSIIISLIVTCHHCCLSFCGAPLKSTGYSSLYLPLGSEGLQFPP